MRRYCPSSYFEFSISTKQQSSLAGHSNNKGILPLSGFSKGGQSTDEPNSDDFGTSVSTSVSSPNRTIIKAATTETTRENRAGGSLGSSCRTASSSTPSSAASSESLVTTESNKSVEILQTYSTSQNSPGNSPRKKSRSKKGGSRPRTDSTSTLESAAFSIKDKAASKTPYVLSTLITRICPEVGLGVQDFRCAECQQHISNRKYLNAKVYTLMSRTIP